VQNTHTSAMPVQGTDDHAQVTDFTVKQSVTWLNS